MASCERGAGFFQGFFWIGCPIAKLCASDVRRCVASRASSAYKWPAPLGPAAASTATTALPTMPGPPFVRSSGSRNLLLVSELSPSCWGTYRWLEEKKGKRNAHWTSSVGKGSSSLMGQGFLPLCPATMQLSQARALCSSGLVTRKRSCPCAVRTQICPDLVSAAVVRSTEAPQHSAAAPQRDLAIVASYVAAASAALLMWTAPGPALAVPPGKADVSLPELVQIVKGAQLGQGQQ